MKFKFIFYLFFLSPVESMAWGFYAHQLINELAIYALPPELFSFYKSNCNYLKLHALDPDKRRYILPKEANKHFVDLDFYEKSVPIDTLPLEFSKAVSKYGMDTILKHGTVPWQIQFTLRNLEDAFCHQNTALILKHSADIGHYMADAHVPLHNTANYNGQFTNQIGIHGLFESRIPELFANQYQCIPLKANYLSNPLAFTWETITEGFGVLPFVFEMENKIRKKIPEHKHYGFTQKGKKWVKIWSFEYAEAYHQALNGLVEKRLIHAAYAISCLWYTAWINAGQPQLVKEKLLPNPLPDSLYHTDEILFLDRNPN
jgi:hypothetical protein